MGAFTSGGSGGSGGSGSSGNYAFSDWVSTSTTGSTLAFHNVGFDNSWWGTNFTLANPPLGALTNKITKATLDEVINKAISQMRETFNRHRIFDAKFSDAEVIASKLLASQLNKENYEFGVSKKLLSGKRNVFLIVSISDENKATLNPATFEVGPNKVNHIVDLCAEQYGSFPVCSPVIDNPPDHWTVEFTYKTPVSLVKRLVKEGRELKFLSLKDAIALSTRYEVSSVKDTCLDSHVINPGDGSGKKFLEKFGKEVGFKTTLAQLLLDADPIVAEKAQIISQIIMQR